MNFFINSKNDFLSLLNLFLKFIALRKLFIHTIFLFAFSVFSAWGQIIGFQNYTIKEGLPQNTVSCIIQDSRGYIWLGTQAGLVRFDGHTFHTYTIADGLADNTVNCIYQDKKGLLWIGTSQGGISVFNGFSFRNITAKNGLISNEIRQIYGDREGGIWVLSAFGLSYLNGSRIKSFSQKNGLPHNNAMCITESKDGFIWCGTQNGVAVFKNGGIVHTYVGEISYIDVDDQKRKSTVWAIQQDMNGEIWIATQGGGVFRYDGKTFTHFNTHDGLASNIVISIFIDRSNNIWFGTYGPGISYFDQKQIRTFSDPDLHNVFFKKFAEDSLGNIWVQSNNTGAYKFSVNGFVHYTMENNLLGDVLNDIYVDREGNTWFAAEGGLSMYGKAIFEIYSTDQGLPDRNVGAVLADHQGNKWIGLSDRLLRFNKDGFIEANLPWKTSPQQILSIYQDKEDRIWAGTYGSVFTRQKSNEFVRSQISKHLAYSTAVNDIYQDDSLNIWLGTEQGLFVAHKNGSVRQITESGVIHKNVQSILMDKSHKLWLATAEGVVIYNGKTTKIYNRQNGLPNNFCTSLIRDSLDNVWVGTDGGGICGFIKDGADKYLMKIIGLKEGLSNANIMSLVFDNEGYLWAGHLKGLDRIDLKNLKVVFYGEQDGFTPIETYQNAVSKDPSGNIWFGTVNGLVKYVPGNNRPNTLPPQTYITDVRFTNSSESIMKYAEGIDSITHLPVKLKLPYNRNFLTFDFVGISFEIPQKVKYQIKLDGYDEQWSVLTSVSTYDYKKLPNGKYTFLVRSYNNDGVPTAEPVAFSFEIKPPFWKTTWFILLEIIFVIFIIIQVIRYRERQLQKEKKILEEKVKERTAEIEHQKKQIEDANEELLEQQQEILAQRDEIERQRDIAEQQRDQITLQKKEITDSIHYARRIQTAILTPEENAKSILGEYFILFKPRDIVSGDFYWMSRHNDKIIVVAADCTGHGVPGAFMSMLGVSLLNEIVNKENTTVASDILNKLRENIKTTLSQTGKENEAKDGMDLALCVVDKKEKKLEFAGANNPLYLVRSGELIEYKGDNMPIGIHAGEERPFKNNLVDLQTDDMIYLFSDGFADQFGGPEGGKFKTKPFKRLFMQTHQKPMHEQWLMLEETIESWKGSLDQVDDIMVIGIRI